MPVEHNFEPASNGRRVTLNDLARRTGVSKTAVSLALRNHPSISVTRRSEIRRVAEELGYHPDPLLASLVAYREGSRQIKIHSALAWINHWIEPERLRRYREFDAYWRGAAAAAVRFGYRLEEIQWPRGCSTRRMEQILSSRGIRGLLIPPQNELPPDRGDFDWNKFSVMRLGMSVSSPDSNLVTADIFRAMVMAIRKIHEQGYERIGFIVNGEFNDRLGGNFLGGNYTAQTLLKLKSPMPPLLTFLKEQNAAELNRQKNALQKWLARHKPDAILTADIEVPTLLRELGYRIPQDIAVAGTSVLDIPGIDAGIDQHSEAIGRIAVEMLVKQINMNERGEPTEPCRILVESRWQDGRSLPPRTLH
jgi:DNA-binding LacI/PurR family transcriptional regulator